MDEEQKPCQNALERQINIANSLRDVLSILNSNLELDQILNFIANQAKEILNADAVAIYSTKDVLGYLSIVASHGLPLDYVDVAVIPIGVGATGLASLSGKPVVVADIYHIEDINNVVLDDGTRSIVDKLGRIFRALIAIPLIFSNSKIFGTINLYYKEEHTFSKEEISLAEAYANQTILAIENARLRASAIQSAAQAERNRLARELHDTVSQTLFSISLISGVLPELWQKDHTLGHEALKEINQLSQGALAEMRTLLFELRPAAALSFELETLIQQLVDAFTSRTRVPVKYMYQPLNCIVPPDVKIIFYRVVQESLRNIQKHSHSSNVTISLESVSVEGTLQKKKTLKETNNRKIAVTIKDNGVGFFSGNLSADHFGLRIMQERAGEIGAALNIESEPGIGTQVELVW